MFESMLGYMERLEMQFFFSGFITACAVVYLARKEKLIKYFPVSYALVATLYLGWVLKNLYPDYTIDNMVYSVEYPFYRLLAFTALLFWIPAFRKTWIAIIHSAVFFSMVIYDMTLGADHINNSLKVYLVSIILHLAAFIVIVLFRKALITLTARND